MGIRDRFRRRPEPAATTSAPTSAPSIEASRTRLAAWVSEQLHPGFRARADALEMTREHVEDDPDSFPGLTSADAEAVVASVWSQLEALQASWADEGDYRRLRAAFDALGEEGVVAQMDFTCCQTCGHAEIGELAADDAWGYTFFHQQDSEGLGPGRCDLYLAFGVFRPSPSTDRALLARAEAGDEDARRTVAIDSEVQVAEHVARRLREHGLTVDWDGSVGQRIKVVGLDWRKRLPA